MKHAHDVRFAGAAILVFFCILTITACDRSSSPEGRMSMKVENLQQEMIDSLKQQNRAILDSLGKIREDLKEIKALKK
jgi:hypothetical protein